MSLSRKVLTVVVGAVGVASVLCAILFFILGNSEHARAFLVRWRITQIFESHKNLVRWETAEYVHLHPSVQKEISRWSQATENWQIPAEDYSSLYAPYFSPGTLVHVREVRDVVPQGAVLFVFSLETPVWMFGGARGASGGVSSSWERMPIEQYHDAELYRTVAVIGAWGALDEFPLENFFPIEGMRARTLWVDRTKKFFFTCAFWGGLCFLAGQGLLFEVRLRETIKRVYAPLKKRTPSVIGTVPVVAAEDSFPSEEEHVAESSLPLPLHSGTGEDEAKRRESLKRHRENVFMLIVAEIESLYASAITPRQRELLLEILGQCGGTSRIRVAKAQKLLLRARALCETGAVLADAQEEIVAETAPVDVFSKRQKQRTLENRSLVLPIPLHQSLEGIDLHIAAMGGDPLAARLVLLSFIRPKTQNAFVAGNYTHISLPRKSAEHGAKAISGTEGRRFSSADIAESFALLRKGGVIIESGHSRLFFSLNDDEKNVPYPWCEIIRVVNRARSQFLILRSGGKP